MLMDQDSDGMSAQVILVVEDEIILRMFLADELRDQGYQVLEAGSGDEALDILGAHIDPDLLITDVRMPGAVDGIGLTLHSKNASPWRPVIVSSAHLAPDTAGRADAFLRKPYPSTTLIDLVERLIGPPCRKQRDLPTAS
ncbi:MAG: response regulator [Sphingomonadales bacterium]|nr:response regulator [Sphingomonadales bacterium]MDE2168152.1 response regulator [Sphingomonadales bacterium]